MLKIRLQGKIEDIQWFQRILKQSLDIDITVVSDMYANKGTNQYYRNYMEVNQAKRLNGGK
ncbi:MAG: hypothetical protein LBN22_11570 [Clostridiales Family XIII bacterium]|jgi:hypothetical protein|nr:hypothetical protein [Clostridiales Family XIII bacterium]